MLPQNENRILWETVEVFRRDSAITETVRVESGLTDVEMDALFVEAASYEGE